MQFCAPFDRPCVLRSVELMVFIALHEVLCPLVRILVFYVYLSDTLSVLYLVFSSLSYIVSCTLFEPVGRSCFVFCYVGRVLRMFR